MNNLQLAYIKILRHLSESLEEFKDKKDNIHNFMHFMDAYLSFTRNKIDERLHIELYDMRPLSDLRYNMYYDIEMNFIRLYNKIFSKSKDYLDTYEKDQYIKFFIYIIEGAAYTYRYGKLNDTIFQEKVFSRLSFKRIPVYSTYYLNDFQNIFIYKNIDTAHCHSGYPFDYNFHTVITLKEIQNSYEIYDKKEEYMYREPGFESIVIPYLT